MKLAIISFTPGGSALCERLKAALEKQGHQCSGYVPDRFLNTHGSEDKLLAYEPPLKAWTENMFQTMEGLIYISAVGIAVRAIAPFIVSKTTDPAVVSVDEKGRFVVPLLSGHLGGANELARMTASVLGADPVITTATDLNQQFSVDVFAKQHELAISDMQLAKRISAQLLESCRIGFYSDFLQKESLHEGLTWKKAQAYNVYITWKAGMTNEIRAGLELKGEEKVLRLIPKAVYMGIGCKKGTSGDTIAQMAREVMEEANVDEKSIAAIASIDIKRREQGLLAYAKALGVSFDTYTAGELAAVRGSFPDSEFVKSITGVGNVCQRAAVLAAIRHGGFERILAEKHAKSGVTISLALGAWDRKKE